MLELFKIYIIAKYSQVRPVEYGVFTILITCIITLMDTIGFY